MWSKLGETSPQPPLAVIVEEADPVEQSGQYQCSIPGGSSLADSVHVPGQQTSNPVVDPVILPSQTEEGKGGSMLLKLTGIKPESQCGDSVVPIAHFITEEEEEELQNPTVYPIADQSSSVRSIKGHKSPKVFAVVEGCKLPMLLDTGAEVSVVPKSFLSQVLSTPTTQQRTVTSFGGAEILLEGPRHLQVEICGVKIVHPFYSLDSNTPVVAGFDLIVAAKLVIDTEHCCAYSYYSCPAPIPHLVRSRHNKVKVTPGSQLGSTLHLTDSTAGTQQCQGPSAPSSLTSTDAPSHPQSVTTSYECAERISTIAGATEPEIPSDIQASALPEHVRLLFESTVKDSNLSASTVTGLHDLLNKHVDTFAKSSTDLGFCSVLQHDIDCRPQTYQAAATTTSVGSS